MPDTGSNIIIDISGNTANMATEFASSGSGITNAHVPIQKIITYEYWTKLQNYLQGYERSFKLCKQQCGKIVSSIEKTEEN